MQSTTTAKAKSKTPLTDKLKHVKHSDKSVWLRNRLQGLTASDCLIVAGAGSEYHPSPYELFGIKTGTLVREEATGKHALKMRMGLEHERAVAKVYREVTGRATENPGQFTRIIHAELDFLSFTPDRLLHGFDTVDVRELAEAGIDYEIIDGTNLATDFAGPGVLEIKTTGQWMGEQWDNEVPIGHMIQLQFQLLCSGYTWGSICVLIGGNDCRIFDIGRDEELCEMLAIVCKNFWLENVQKDVAPDIETKDRGLFFDAHPRKEKKSIVLPIALEDTIADLETLRAEKKAFDKRGRELDKEKKALETKVLQAIGDAHFGVRADGKGTYERAETHRKGFEVKPSVNTSLKFKAKKEEFGATA